MGGVQEIYDFLNGVHLTYKMVNTELEAMSCLI